MPDRLWPHPVVEVPWRGISDAGRLPSIRIELSRHTSATLSNGARPALVATFR